MRNVPGYLDLMERGLLEHRVEELTSMLRNCRLCRRECGVDRTRGERGWCGAGGVMEVSSTCVHRGEEPVLMGDAGVGNVFLARCTMHCVYCQNHSISQPGPGRRPEWGMTPQELAMRLLEFQKSGCPTAGFVTPTHYAPIVFQAVALAASRGFRLPVIYNTGTYDSMDLLGLLDGLVDIYLPDMKYSDPVPGEEYSEAPGYPAFSREAVLEMHRQVGDLAVDEHGTAFRGLLIRLLVLPGGVSGTEDTLRFIARELGTGTFVSLMSQYYPTHMAGSHPPLDRRLRPGEYRRAEDLLVELGFENGWVQDPVDSPDTCLPGIDFSL
ncbi:MAG: hypothetical protein AVO35_01805 [Candidatus Aegiribacteria sp. MLS_C]|nr:MAG: hypothetical protein AVO35_01805 [Candidatus Aegiribacteria sp. MLS_C]